MIQQVSTSTNRLLVISANRAEGPFLKQTHHCMWYLEGIIWILGSQISKIYCTNMVHKFVTTTTDRNSDDDDIKDYTSD